MTFSGKSDLRRSYKRTLIASSKCISITSDSKNLAYSKGVFQTTVERKDNSINEIERNPSHKFSTDQHKIYIKSMNLEKENFGKYTIFRRG